MRKTSFAATLETLAMAKKVTSLPKLIAELRKWVENPQNKQFVLDNACAKLERFLEPLWAAIINPLNSLAAWYGNLGALEVIEEKQEVESPVKVDTKDYVIKSGDTLWAIAKAEYGDGRQWKRIYEFNKEELPDPNRPKKGTHIKIPIE